MKLNTTSARQSAFRKGFTLVELLVVIAIIAALAGLSYGPIMKQINAADRTEAISNGRTITTALLAFYGNNERQYPAQGATITSSSVAFQELVDTAIVDDEKFFWNRTNAAVLTVPALAEPVNDNTLNAAENVWSYVQNLDAGDGAAPIIVDSSNNGTTFNTLIWDGKAIICRVDGSAQVESINFTPPLLNNVAQVAAVLDNSGLDIMATANLPTGAVVVAP